MKKRCTAILLAAGEGKRMGGSVAKQYMLLGDKPVIWYGLQAFHASAVIDDILLVVGAGERAYVEKELVEKCGFLKIRRIVEGGAERYLSVQNALMVLRDEEDFTANREGYVFIHDGARPFVTEKLIEDTFRAAEEYGACCAAVPVKDTIKIADEAGFALQTPPRSSLFAVQTPQVFAAPLILEAYARFEEWEKTLPEGGEMPTDDAMIVERFSGAKVKLVEASYKNLKITTQEDLALAEEILKRRGLLYAAYSEK